MKTISSESDFFKEISYKVIAAISGLSDQTTNEKVINIFDNYTNTEENLTRVRLSTVVFESKKSRKEVYQCYVTLYFHGSDVNYRADIITNFLEAGHADEIFLKFGFRLGDISKSRDASRNLGRGNVENRSSFSLSLIYEIFS